MLDDSLTNTVLLIMLTISDKASNYTDP